MKKTPTILFLYSELAGYFLACIKKLSQLYDLDIHIVRWELNTQAPFDFNIPEAIKVYTKSEFDSSGLQKLIYRIDPDLIYCCGWMDKDYLEICKRFRKAGVPVVAGMDNHWRRTFKQILALFVSRFTIKNYFSHIWVAGEPQKDYARKLGFRDDKILAGCYSADVDFFHNIFLQKHKKNLIEKRRFIFVGRYLEYKGLKDLWKAFTQFHKKRKSDWELWCLGTGPLEASRPAHDKIKHFGFVQPDELPEFLMKSNVFILPSHHEPWGVVVHEFAAAGFPILCSDGVGAATAFVEDSMNGYVFESGNIQALEESMHRIADLPDERLKLMGENSVRKSKKITPATWSDTLISLLQ